MGYETAGRGRTANAGRSSTAGIKAAGRGQTAIASQSSTAGTGKVDDGVTIAKVKKLTQDEAFSILRTAWDSKSTHSMRFLAQTIERFKEEEGVKDIYVALTGQNDPYLKSIAQGHSSMSFLAKEILNKKSFESIKRGTTIPPAPNPFKGGDG
jgi:wobble nucleotide-excising tRNase